MNEPISEERIRELAFRLWEQAGCPEGRSEEFWDLAQTQVGAQTDGSDDGAKKA
ncbi:DUF2934 domain-containing protein [Caballeronia sp. RCC_10]|uniref:DUF2934 domain-containing protein n=1 Tax=Caballeronia sp. RCC_10 TaxID=3239227 RepID=UPI0035232C24